MPSPNPSPSSPSATSNISTFTPDTTTPDISNLPPGIELRIHDSSLREIKALEASERDRRSRLQQTSRYIPAQEILHAHSEATCLLLGLQSSPDENDATPINSYPAVTRARRHYFEAKEEEERGRRTSCSADVVFASVMRGHCEARAFMSGVMAAGSDPDAPGVVRRASLAVVDAEEEGEREERVAEVEEGSGVGVQNAGREALIVKEGLESGGVSAELSKVIAGVEAVALESGRGLDEGALTETVAPAADAVHPTETKNDTRPEKEHKSMGEMMAKALKGAGKVLHKGHLADLATDKHVAGAAEVDAPVGGGKRA
ncbi:hypothetical protein HDV00_008851 [Rhizophlyctis rosea]|nr:hypothetical protein HDV00_008851 [Rhizophlyctis rosea]